MSLVITIGCPGSGKSTWAEANLEPTRLRLERDRFRECLFGSRRAYHEHRFERSAKSAAVTQAMMSAMIYWPIADWAVTDTGLDLPAVQPFIYHAQRVGVPIQLVVFDRPYMLLLERNATRDEEHRVPEDILQERYQKFCDPEAWWRSPQWMKEYVF